MKLTELKKISPERLKLLREVEPLRPLSRKGGRVYFSELGKGFSERTLESNAVKFAAGDDSATPLKLFEWHPTMKVHYFISARESNPARYQSAALSSEEKPMSTDVRSVLRSGMTALFDSMAGMIPVKVLSITGESGAPSSRQEVKARVTRDTGGYKKGEVLSEWGLRIVPRAAFSARRHGARITYYTVEVDRAHNPHRKHIHTAKFERCVRDVSKRGTAKDPYAVCTAGIGYRGSLKAGHRRRNPARGELDEVAGRELELYADNDSSLYNQKKSIIKNLQVKMARGEYDPAKAAKLWSYWLDAAAKAYAREFGGSWHETFSTATRAWAARRVEAHERSRIERDEYGLKSELPKKYRERNPAREYGVFVSGVLKRSYGSEHHAEQYARALRLHKPFKGERIEVMRLPASVKPMRASNPIRPVYYTVHAHKGSEKFWLGRDGKLHRKQSDGKRFRTVIEAKDAARRHLTKFPSSRSYRFEIQLAY
jgi:hypothetical protein